MKGYLFFDPLRKQYIFPPDYKKYPVFNDFCKPSRRIAKILWWAWNNITIFRKQCVVKSLDGFVPNNIRTNVDHNALLAYNRGSNGPEKKLTALGVNPETGKSFFLKYGESDTARKNVSNEGHVLSQLQHLNFVPKLNRMIEVNDYTLIETSVLKGSKLDKNYFTEELLKALLTISRQRVQLNANYNFQCKTSFAHGDFCPWNLLSSNEEIKVFDWELAGIYPIGYDLFSFIFQVEALVNRKKRFNKLILENQPSITKYFAVWNIPDWRPYLLAFAEHKKELERIKNNRRLFSFYTSLNQYAATL